MPHSEIRIDVNKIYNISSELEESSKENNELQEMTAAMDKICKYLAKENDEFVAAEFCGLILEYIKKYDRLLYASISDKIFFYKTSNKEDRISSMLANIEITSDFVYSVATKNEYEELVKKYSEVQVNLKKIIIKISDHMNLAIKQTESLKLSKKEYEDRFQESMKPIISDMQKEMNAQLITLVGIFTALAFLVFGSISSFENTFTMLDKPIFKLMLVGTIWSIGLINLVFVFLFCVSKMTDLSFKSTENVNASLFRKYPIVAWANYFLISILALSAVGLFITENKITLNVVNWAKNGNNILWGIVGIIIVIVIMGFVVTLITKAENKN